MAARFAELSENELSCAYLKLLAKTAVNVFRHYLEARQNNEDDLVGSKETLANVLRKFYAEARKK